jgi:hypothetical protein
LDYLIPIDLRRQAVAVLKGAGGVGRHSIRRSDQRGDGQAFSEVGSPALDQRVGEAKDDWCGKRDSAAARSRELADHDVKVGY